MTKMPFNDNTDRIKVIVRIRPKMEREYNQSNTFLMLEGNSIAVLTKKESKQFTFDYIASEDSSQSELFQQSAKDICDYALQGYNGTIFAYGQTGAGKTHTLLGPKFFQSNSFFRDPNSSIRESPIINRGYLTFTQRKEEEGRGVLPRSIEYLFAKAKELKGNDPQLVINFSCSFLEIYQEQISDLLDSNNINKQVLIRDLSDSVLIENLTKWTILSPEEAYSLVIRGNNLRHIALTAMNKESSRSHAIFSIYIEIKAKTANGHLKLTKSVFHLIDLAGSERQKATECIGDRLKEAGKINKSLMQLSHVIKSLTAIPSQSSKQKAYIPYRDSKLTHLLKDSLGGNAKTSIIVNISSSRENIQETISTLLFAQSAKLIKNKAVINEEITDTSSQSHEELMSLKEKYNLMKSENYYLMNLLEKNTSTGLSLNPSEFSKTIDCVEDEIENMHLEITEKNKQIGALSAEIDAFKEKIQKTFIEIRMKDKELMERKELARIAKGEYDALKEKLKTFVLNNAYHTDTLHVIGNDKVVDLQCYRNHLIQLANELKERQFALSRKEQSLSNEMSQLNQKQLLLDEENTSKQQQLNHLNELNGVLEVKDNQLKEKIDNHDLKQRELNEMKEHDELKAKELTQGKKRIEAIILIRNETISEKKCQLNRIKLSLIDKEEKAGVVNRELTEMKLKIDAQAQEKDKIAKAIEETKERIFALDKDKGLLLSTISSMQSNQKESKNKNISLCERLNQLTENKNVNCTKVSLLTKIKIENKKLNEDYFTLKKSFSRLNANLNSVLNSTESRDSNSQVNITDLVNCSKRELNQANGLLTQMTKRMKGVNDDSETMPHLAISQEEAFALYFDRFIELNQGKIKEETAYKERIQLKEKAIAGLQKKLMNDKVPPSPSEKRFSCQLPLKITKDGDQFAFNKHKRKFCDFTPFEEKINHLNQSIPISLSFDENRKHELNG